MKKDCFAQVDVLLQQLEHEHINKLLVKKRVNKDLHAKTF